MKSVLKNILLGGGSFFDISGNSRVGNPNCFSTKISTDNAFYTSPYSDTLNIGFDWRHVASDLNTAVRKIGTGNSE